MLDIASLSWNRKANQEYGLDRGVFYLKNSPGEVWNGLKSIKEHSSDSGLHALYLDGVKTHQRRKIGHFSGEIKAISYPIKLYEDGIVRKRPKRFDLSYRTQAGEGYKIHLVYNVLLAAEQRIHQVGEFEPFTQTFSTMPVPIPGGTRSAHIVIDTNVAYSWTVAELEEILYGTETTDPRLPLPDEILQIFEDNSILQIIDHGDGTWTAIGPDDVVVMLDSTTFQITWPSAVYINAESYTIHSL